MADNATTASVQTPSSATTPPAGPRSSGARLALVGLLIALLAVFLLKDNTLFEPSYEEIYGEYQALLARTKELAGKRASEAEWDAFEKEAKQRLAPIVEELEALCKQHPAMRPTSLGGTQADKTTQYIRQPLRQIGQYDLPRAIANARTGKPLADGPIQAQLAVVRGALDALRLGHTTDGK